MAAPCKKSRLSSPRAVLVAVITIAGAFSPMLFGSAVADASQTDCLSYGYACTPGYDGTNTEGTWAWTHYGGSVALNANGYHNCTLYAAWRLEQNGMADPGNWGNAVDWINHTSHDHTSALGSIAYWGSEVGGGFGHVAYVDQINGSKVHVIADNYAGPTSDGYTDSGWIPATSVDYFLHPHDLPNAPSVLTSSLAVTMTGEPYSAALSASGGVAPYTWAVTVGSLPPGLSLSADGMITGTPTSNGNYPFTVSVTGANNASSSETLTMNVDPGGNLLANGSFTFPPAPWKVIPAGAGTVNLTSFHHLDGVSPQQGSWFGASNTSTPGGVFYQDIPAAAQPGQTYTFSIWLRSLNGKPATGTVTLFAEGGTLEHDQTRFTIGRTWTLVSVPLDIYQAGHTGLRVAVYENTTGISYIFDGASLASDTGTYAVLPAFTADAPPATATLHHAYRYTFKATGDPAPAFAVSSGKLPPGLHLDITTGVLSGTPKTRGTFHFLISASNGIQPSAVTRTLTVTVRK